MENKCLKIVTRIYRSKTKAALVGPLSRNLVDEDRTERACVSDLYCPDCGKGGGVWALKGGGCFYEGERHYCVSCATIFTIPTLYKISLEDEYDHDTQVINKIREALNGK